MGERGSIPKNPEKFFYDPGRFLFEFGLVEKARGLDHAAGGQAVDAAENFFVSCRLGPPIAKGEQFLFDVTERAVIDSGQMNGAVEIAFFRNMVRPGEAFELVARKRRLELGVRPHVGQAFPMVRVGIEGGGEQPVQNEGLLQAADNPFGHLLVRGVSQHPARQREAP